jgi:hypothetical protein
MAAGRIFRLFRYFRGRELNASCKPFATLANRHFVRFLDRARVRSRETGVCQWRPACQSSTLGASVNSVSGFDYSPVEMLNGVDLLPFLAGGDAAVPHEKLFWTNRPNNSMR